MSEEQLARLEDLARMWVAVAEDADDGHSRGLRLCARQLAQVCGEIRAEMPVQYALTEAGRDA